MDLIDAVVVVTGAGSGIGRSIALSFAAEGARLVSADVDEEAARIVAAEAEAMGAKAIAVGVDVASEGSVRKLADRSFATFGQVNVLCNNAGVALRPFRPSWVASAADYRWMMDVNYFGVVNGVLAFVPRMRTQAGLRHIVNTSSFAALDTSPGLAAYAATKSAVTSLSDALREELRDHGDDFGVTVLFPGAVRTGIAGSERLRPESERSATRDVQPYRPSRVSPEWAVDALDAETVGPLVVEAVRNNAPTSLTHAPPTDALRARLRAVESGYLGPVVSHRSAAVSKG